MEDAELISLIKSCLKKKRYPTEQTAQEAINRIHKKRNTPLRYYYCKKCCGYHLTKKYCGDRNTIDKNIEINKY